MSESVIASFEVTYEYEDERLDKFLAAVFPERSRTYFSKLIKDGHVTMDGKTLKANYRLHTDDLITVSTPPAERVEINPENIPLDILYEDQDLLIVNKPKGMVVHPSAGHYSGTLVNAVMFHCGNELSGINGVVRPGIVHRIDKDTTGSLIICKTDAAHIHIAEQIKNHSCNRRYRGIVIGNIKDEEGTVTGAIGRDPKDRKKMAINEKNGKPAVTHYKVLERFGNFTYMEFALETGRTHQIRVHMSSIGHPLLGDEVYGGRHACGKWKLQGQTLHAMNLGFVHPTTGEFLEISAKLPEYFEKLLADLRQK
ncbi:MAG: RluA family pseudouridine synthase [bacterium]|nr:RluA family pseudouridine synthase [bacterium]MDY4099074.1 RluA family pseudouridine synthase [Lachnospiraceae bacterium]